MDVFPLDEYRDYAKVRRAEFKRRILQILWLASISKYKKFNSLKGFIINALVFVVRNILGLSPNRIARKINQQSRALSCNGENLMLYADSNLKKPLRLKKNWYEEFELHRFEQHSFYIPNGWHDVLKTSYGDYMQLLPIEQRVTHHSFTAYWKTSEYEVQ